MSAVESSAAVLAWRDDLGRIEPGVKADLVLIKNDASPVSFPFLNPYGQVVFQAQRGDVHTVIVDGKVVKHEHRLVGVDLAAVRRVVDATVERFKARPPAHRSAIEPCRGRGT